MYYCESFQGCVSLYRCEDANILIYFQKARVSLIYFSMKHYLTIRSDYTL